MMPALTELVLLRISNIVYRFSKPVPALDP